jgi:adenine-specific DNA-methyltransferase
MEKGLTPKSIWDDVGTTTNGTQELEDILGEKKFNNPKPVSLIRRIIELSVDKNGVILDFMAGSGTTGHAVLELNKEDDGNRQFILCTNNENNICTDVCYPRLKKVIDGYKDLNGKKVEGLGGDLKYYTCDFVEAEPTDRNKRKLVNECTEMLCIHENTFDLALDGNDFKIFRGSDRYLGIVYYEDAIDQFKKAIAKIKGRCNAYVFSMTDDPHKDQFASVADKVTLCAIPEVILKVYREIFKET